MACYPPSLRNFEKVLDKVIQMWYNGVAEVTWATLDNSFLFIRAPRRDVASVRDLSSFSRALDRTLAWRKWERS